MTDSSQTTNGSVFTIRLDARPDHLMLVRQAIEGAVLPLGADPDLVNDIKLAVTEACSNVVRYAYGDGDGSMIVSLNRLDDKLQIVVRDFGSWRPNDQKPADEISGMGIPLIKSVTHSEEISHLEDGTSVSMVFSMDRADRG